MLLVHFQEDMSTEGTSDGEIPPLKKEVTWKESSKRAAMTMARRATVAYAYMKRRSRSDDIILNQAPKMGNESDKDHSK
ncbi:hypothetical protein ZIOFF_062025 [Zingiber officinale]|uniref:Uncharacterized protein n=1 Tax=Zingiber officinale TaxID=94328 RepID=A0A8J5EZT8_ZINOF|nr:hypothetical protein ZIOFF_062025 [Zingiber officinale]